MKTISIIAQKGGVGKTAITTHIAACLAKKGKKVIVIDLDQQMNLTQSYKIKSDFTVLNFLENGFDNFSYEKKEGVFFISGSNDLDLWQFPLEALKDKLEILKELKIEGSKLDYCLIDLNPSSPLPKKFSEEYYSYSAKISKEPLHNLNGLALYASDGILCPVNPSQHSVNSIIHLWGKLEVFKEKFQPNLKLIGLIMNRYIENRIASEKWLTTLESSLPDYLFKTIIHESVDIEKATDKGVSVLQFAHNSRSAKEFKQLTKEFLTKI